MATNTLAKLINHFMLQTGWKLSRVDASQPKMDTLRLKRYLAEDIPHDPPTVALLEHVVRYAPESKSQLMQDLFVDFVLQRTGGIFCECGATDGINLSNSYWLETRRKWTGVLSEPAKCWHKKIKRNRPKAKIDTRCLWTVSDQTVLFNEVNFPELSTIDAFSYSDTHRRERRKGKRYNVFTISLNDLIETNIGKKPIDYLSIDTEGSEFDILKSFDFKSYDPKVITVEHNYADSRNKIYSLLIVNGYTRVFESLSLFDDWYVKAECWHACLRGRNIEADSPNL